MQIALCRILTSRNECDWSNVALSLPTTPEGLELESAFLAVGEQLEKKHRANMSRPGRRKGALRDRMEARMAAARDAASSAEMPGGQVTSTARVQPDRPEIMAKAVEAAEGPMAQLLVGNLNSSIARSHCWEPNMNWRVHHCRYIQYSYM